VDHLERIPKWQWLQQLDHENGASQLLAACRDTSYNGEKRTSDQKGHRNGGWTNVDQSNTWLLSHNEQSEQSGTIFVRHI